MCQKYLHIMLGLNTVLIFISLIFLACNSSHYNNFKNVNNWKAKDIKGRLDVATLQLSTKEIEREFVNKFRGYEIGFTVTIFLCLIILIGFLILLSKLTIDSDEKANMVPLIAYFIYFIITCNFILFVAKLVIHSYSVHIYDRYSIPEISDFIAKNAGGLVISIFGFIFMIPIYVGFRDLTVNISAHYKNEKERKERLAKLAQERNQRNNQNNNNINQNQIVLASENHNLRGNQVVIINNRNI